MMLLKLCLFLFGMLLTSVMTARFISLSVCPRAAFADPFLLRSIVFVASFIATFFIGGYFVLITAFRFVR